MDLDEEHIKKTFSKQDVCESLAIIAMEYPLPYIEISEADALKELENKLVTFKIYHCTRI